MPDLQQTTIWVLASGPHDDLEAALPWAGTPDHVVAADGGTALANLLVITPNLIVGDLDSSPPELVERYERMGVDIRRYDHETKWETDTELALLAAIDLHPTTIVLLGALGGRLDHSLANVLLLTHPRFAPIDIRILDGPHEVFLAKPATWNKIHGNPGDTLTLLPVGSDAHGVSTRGLHWPLHAETLPMGHGRGVSNRIDADESAVWVEDGLLLVLTLHA